MAIQTLSDLKTALAITGTGDDALLTQLQTAADSFVGEFCGRSFEGGTFTEDHPGGTRVLFLRNFPVVTVGSVKVDLLRQFGTGTVRDASTFTVHPERGVVESLSGPFVVTHPGWPPQRNEFPNTVRVVYTTATNAMPGVITQAYGELIGHWYRQAKTHVATGQLNVVTQVNGTTSTTYPWGQSTGMKVPASVLALLNTVRVPRL